ncbi:alpha,alpha-trehalase TreF [uncultured Sphingomonas sp.]|uniref:alpha,alpha-trehalase TreF n=1 Tax=uncultured Sphingomonas sp. TaxID=158754 RepID=UPI00261E6BFA|nr:alpha,alpha-trehalase TreF [uncultured Sphingomonas sp.]
MSVRSLLALPLCALALAAAAPAPSAGDRATAVSRAAGTPEDIFGPLYSAVELARVFPDSKTFADMIPRETPDAIMAAYRHDAPQGRDALAAFVARHFRKAGDTGSAQLSMREHIKALWPILAKPPLATVPGSSALQLPYAYVVAGGRYQEMYYWDSYFTMLGLKADGERPLIESMLANFVSMVARYGHVPNGTRSYYLSRSQPPFLALMMDLSDTHDPAIDRERLAALEAEHAYWMAGAACLDAGGACQHVVRMPDGSLLNRYWDARDTPRDESYAEDVATDAAAAPRPAAQVNRDLRAGAESGWDYGSRWLKDGRTLATIHTTDIVPVDLNSLMWNLERAIARRCKAAGDTACAAAFEKQAAARQRAITTYLWSAADTRFVDWDRSTGRPTPAISAALLYPLFVGLATPAQADATAALAKAQLFAPGGLRTTTVRTGQQWDEPNGWAPLLWIAVGGLDRSGQGALADDLARRWVTTVSTFYACTGRMVEKYDIDSGKAGGGGEYPVQDGFGWTNGVTRALLDRPGIATAIVSDCPR